MGKKRSRAAGAESPAVEGPGFRFWQGRRARGKEWSARQFLDSQEVDHGFYEPAWRTFRFGIDHAPLAPPRPGGYIGAADGVAAVDRVTYVDEGEYLEAPLTNAEYRWLAQHDLPRLTPNRIAILRRIQAWDAEVAEMISRMQKRMPAFAGGSSSELTPPSTKSTGFLTPTSPQSARRRARRKRS